MVAAGFSTCRTQCAKTRNKQERGCRQRNGGHSRQLIARHLSCARVRRGDRIQDEVERCACSNKAQVNHRGVNDVNWAQRTKGQLRIETRVRLDQVEEYVHVLIERQCSGIGIIVSAASVISDKAVKCSDTSKGCCIAVAYGLAKVVVQGHITCQSGGQIACAFTARTTIRDRGCHSRTKEERRCTCDYRSRERCFHDTVSILVTNQWVRYCFLKNTQGKRLFLDESLS